ncbi:MAG TPA: CYTH domain-containing protein [Patescibacteria group bacterium]|jgi:adenylate cyclase class 2|nr:CYTH domain-containing protein [Patescibacteria group bacterium]
MQTEIEAKWLNIDHAKFREILQKAGAKLEHPDRLMRRHNFHHPEAQAKHGWVRVRDEGSKVTLSYKEMASRSLHGMQEINLVVDDFDKACDFVSAINFRTANYQETRRESWKLGNVEIELDTWPWIPGFTEIEAPTEELFNSTATKLGLDVKDAVYGDVAIAYQAVYNIPDEYEVYNWPEIKFIQVPEWLETRRV